MNIITYTQTMLDTFDVTPFSHVDSLVLSQLAYINYNDITQPLGSWRKHIAVKDLLKIELFDKLLIDVRDPQRNKELILAVGMSPRFRDVQICHFIDIIDTTLQKQFSAVTFIINKKLAYIAYRGTDSTFVGWKEDFNMTYMSPVPAQADGATYLNKVAKSIRHELIVGGHSKGGNIAVYASMEASPKIQNRIKVIYTHDGPGFRNEIFNSHKYHSIKDKIHKTIPQSAVVGTLLQYQEDYYTVKSNQFWIMQHDPFSWVVQDNDFIYEEEVTSGAKYLNTTIKQWLETLDDEKRELFISTLYEVLLATKTERIEDLTTDWFKKLQSVIEAANNVDKETQSFLMDTIKSLISLSFRNIPSPLKNFSFPMMKSKAD